MGGRVLVVDDERGVRESLRLLLESECEVDTATDVGTALASIRAEPPDLVLLDLVMPGRGGLALLAELEADPAPPPVMVLSATRSVATAVDAMKCGAVDYLTKPFEVNELRIKVRERLERRALEREVALPRAQLDTPERVGDLIGHSTAMRDVFRAIQRLAESPTTVLITGESGTGKELAARALHELGPRAAGPFVTINCAAVPASLMESELFGHERGAFTDARERRVGRFEAAGGGTLFLDEIGELDAGVQAKLLRALAERRIERLGGDASIELDARLLVATNRDLLHEVEVGRFRKDLFYRIQGVPLELPPLRDRRDDVRQLTLHFLAAAREAAGRGPDRIAPSVYAALERHAWPGNVRELRNAIEHAVALAETEVVQLGDLPPALVRATQLRGLRDAVGSGGLGLDEALGELERGLLAEALAAAGWNQTRAAGRLRITRRALKLRMDRHGLTPPVT